MQSTALRELHTYAAAPVVPDDFGPEGPLEESAPKSPLQPTSVHLHIPDLIIDNHEELKVGAVVWNCAELAYVGFKLVVSVQISA